MTAEDIELLQEKIVQLCHAAGIFGVPDARILRTLQKASYPLDAAALDRHLRYLKSKGWIAELEKELRPDLRRWESTALGDEYLMKQGLI
jgi:hypothetical protein